jgi:hypothetical protein
VITDVQPLVVVVVLSTFTVAAPQESDAVGGVKPGVAVHAKVAFAPGDPMVGAGQTTVTFFSQNCVPKSGLSKVISIWTVKLVVPALTVTVPPLLAPDIVAAPLGSMDHTK